MLKARPFSSTSRNSLCLKLIKSKTGSINVCLLTSGKARNMRLNKFLLLIFVIGPQVESVSNVSAPF